MLSDFALYISGWKKLEKIGENSFGENLAMGLMFFNPNLGGLLRSLFGGGGRGGGKIIPMSKSR